MNCRELLLDMHERCHRSLGQFMSHCRTVPEPDLGRRLEGFGYPTIRAQLQHLIGAERYWFSVLQDRTNAEDVEAASLDALESLRSAVYDEARACLRAATNDELTMPRTMTTWGGHEPALVPAYVMLRTQTHMFHHLGQIAAMCRQLGHPVPEGMDFPLN